MSHSAWSCQRSVIFDDYIFIKTYHDGLKNFPKYMLFNFKQDPHEQNNLADQRPDLVEKGLALLNTWYDEMMAKSEDGIDPMQVVLQEGGPFHTRGMLEGYCERLEKTGRKEAAEKLKSQHQD